MPDFCRAIDAGTRSQTCRIKAVVLKGTPMTEPSDAAWLALCESEADRINREAQDRKPATVTDVELLLEQIAVGARQVWPPGRRQYIATLLIDELAPTVAEVRAAVNLYLTTMAADSRFPPTAGALLRCLMRCRSEKAR